jgi:hypothetical protein
VPFGLSSPPAAAAPGALHSLRYYAVGAMCFFGDLTQAGGNSHTSFFMLYRRRRRTHPPAVAGGTGKPTGLRAQRPVGFPVHPATGSGRCSCMWVRLRPVCLVVPGADLR